MRQKFAVTVADVHMNIVCDETSETIDRAVREVDEQIRSLCGAGSGCNRTEAAMLSALDCRTRCMHLEERVKELESVLSAADPNGDRYSASLLRGENEALRAQLQVSRGEYEALLSDNATLFGLNAKLTRQSTESGNRADRMHDQVLSILTEVRELREKLAAQCVETREPSPSYGVAEPAPEIEVTPAEQQVMKKYEQMDLDAMLAESPRNAEHG